jgi:hypothetical protein
VALSIFFNLNNNYKYFIILSNFTMFYIISNSLKILFNNLISKDNIFKKHS